MTRLADRLASPCSQRWMDLVPRGEGRYCAQCDTTVVDLSRLTKREALERTREGACVRVRLDERGEPLFRPDPERRLGRRALAVVAALAGGCTASAPSQPEVSVEVAPAPVNPPPEVPDGVAIDQLDAEALAALEDASIAEVEADPVPTPEQIALTRQKRARRHPVVPPRVHFLGGMLPAADF